MPLPYYCPALNKRAPDAPPHAWMNENKLSAFLEELLGENPRLIAEALSAGGDRGAKTAARRALLEERLQGARADYSLKEAEARQRAAARAAAAGVREQPPVFASVVAEVTRDLLEAECEALAALEGELAQLSAQAGQDRQAARVLAAVEQLRGGLDADTDDPAVARTGAGMGDRTMDVRTRNSLLKAVFEEIVVHALSPRTRKGVTVPLPTGEDAHPCGCLVMRLAGVETPLPAVRVRRGYGKSLRLPTVAEWITDVFALAPVEEESASIPGPRLRRTFCSVITEARSDTPVGLLAARVLADGTFPRRSRGKQGIDSHMAQEPLYDGGA